ncbi:uncharacterized protein LOC118754085 [Rhagoletis pomonella]|uniref:uncharacterized protein LOC118754085 n=1 Tax=Rhagoletis pomonella TaxID=28610 RepID=UPI0017837671|nr:uncharacterized protein LOC118754085 [Rhagoletis pomonella]
MENYCVYANDATSEVNNWVLFTTEQPVTSEGAIEAPENSVLPEINESTLSTVGEDNSTIEDDENLKTLLKEFRLECIFENLKAAQITYRCLKYIQKEDLKEAVLHLGLRIEFREKLFAWRKNKVN